MTSSPNHPTPSLEGRKIILGVTGGIAAYKAALLVRLLKLAGADVQVLMTPDASRFITPLTLGTLSGRDVLVDIFPDDAEGGWTRHVHLGEWADLMVIAPATAQSLAKLAHGFCDSMLTATALSARCRILVCPAMDHEMYLNAATQANLDRLRSFGYLVMEPEEGELASGLTGKGRLPEPESIFAEIASLLAPADSALAGRTVVITAGPTREALDPVRYLTNHSSGKMGYALAESALSHGARVILVSGPVDIRPPAGAEVIGVTSADEMLGAVESHAGADVFIMAAAVSDYRPARYSSSKIKKSSTDISLHLARTPDILATVCQQRNEGQVVVGFALETDDPLENARRKLEEKGCDMIVLNNPLAEGAGFGSDTNQVSILEADGTVTDVPLMTKRRVANEIVARVGARFSARVR